MLWYKFNGTWQTWDYLHNTLGYSENATYSVSYKQASQANWGRAYTGDGYHDGSQNDYTDGLFWADGKVGWYDLNGLAETCELYPSDAIIGPIFTNGGQTSNSVFVRDRYQDEYYLIQADLQLGWVTVEEAADAGWNITEREKISICGVLTATSDEVVEVETPYQLENGGINFTGELRANVIPQSGVVKEYAPPIIMLFGVLYSQGNFKQDFVSDFCRFNAMPITQADADTVTAFGLELDYAGIYGPYGAVQWSDNYEYEPLGVYVDMDGDNEYTDVDVDGLYCIENDSAGRSVAMCSHNYYRGSQVMTWRCRITKK